MSIPYIKSHQLSTYGHSEAYTPNMDGVSPDHGDHWQMMVDRTPCSSVFCDAAFVWWTARRKKSRSRRSVRARTLDLNTLVIALILFPDSKAVYEWATFPLKQGVMTVTHDEYRRHSKGRELLGSV